MPDKKIHFLTLDEVVEIHRQLVSSPLNGGSSMREGILRACLALPSNRIGGRYAHQDLFEMAAAYLFHIVQNRPFVSGNRKVAAMTALFFLHLHNISSEPPSDLYLDTIALVRMGKISKNQVADFFRSHCLD